MADGKSEKQAGLDWAQAKLNEAARHLHDKQRVGRLTQAKLSWGLPYDIVLGQIFDASDRDKAFWVVNGEDWPMDFAELSVAATPREAVRHFALRWQLSGAQIVRQAARGDNPTLKQTDWSEIDSYMEGKAEALYDLSETDEHW